MHVAPFLLQKCEFSERDFVRGLSSLTTPNTVFYTTINVVYGLQRYIRVLQETEDIVASRQGIAKCIGRYLESGTIARRSGSGYSAKITDEVKQIVEEAMRQNDKMTTYQLHMILTRFHSASARSFVVDASSGGRFVEALIVKLSVKPTRLSGWSVLTRRRLTEASAVST